MSINKHLMVALEPVFEAIKSLSKAIDDIQPIQGDAGENGKDGLNGIDGIAPDAKEVAETLALDQDFIKAVTPNIHPSEVAEQLVELHLPKIKGADGAGIESQPYVAGNIYREGSVVVANIGQHFKAIKDTNGTPSESEDWVRIGSGGFKHTGVYNQDKTYQDGDIFTKDFGSFMIVDGNPVLLAGRGAKGERGESIVGRTGNNGRDGTQITSCSVTGFKAVIVTEDSEGLSHIELDFEPAFNERLATMKAELLNVLRAEYDQI